MEREDTIERMRGTSILLFLLAACAHGRPPVDPGLTHGSLSSGGRQRTWLSLDGAPGAPLVIALHGRLGDGASQARLTGFAAIAKREKLFIVFPDGVDKSWHDARESGPAAEQKVDDVQFVSDLIDAFVAKGADPKRVFVLGMSNGGVMSLTLACRLSAKVAGVASVTGGLPAQLEQGCAMSRPVPVVLIFGTDDPLMPYAGGTVAKRKDHGTVSSAEAAAALFARQNGCDATPRLENLPDTSASDASTVELRTFTGCKAPVALYTVRGGGHTWPGGWSYLPERFIGKTNRDFDASEAIWRFFTQ